MIFEFVVGRTRVEYTVTITADTEPFDFIIRDPAGFLQNATMINKRLAEVDRANRYRLLANNPVLWGDLQFYIDVAVFFFPSGTTYAWSVRTHDLLPDTVHSAIESWKQAHKPVMIGTLVAHRQAIHEEVKQAIRARARRQATNMHVNATRILGYLDELEVGTKTSPP